MSHLLKYLSDLPRSFKAAFLLVTDSMVLGFSIMLAFAVRFDPASIVDQFRIYSVGAWVLVVGQLLALLAGGLYRSVLRHASSELLGLLLRSVLLGTGLFALLDLMLEEFRMPRSIIVISASFTFLGFSIPERIFLSEFSTKCYFF